MDDARRHGRHAIPGIKGTLRSPGDVEILDVGLHGMKVKVTETLEVGDRHFLELQHQGHVVNVEVQVRWVVVREVERIRGTLMPVCRAGVEFVDIFRDDVGGIWDWILLPAELLDPGTAT